MSKVFGQARRAVCSRGDTQPCTQSPMGRGRTRPTQVRPRHPTPHLMGCAPPYCNLARLCVSLTVHLLCIPVTAGIFKSDCSPLRLLKTLVYVCRAALHLGKHKQKLPAYSVLPTSLSHHLDSPRRYAQHCPCWPIGGLLVIAGQHSRVGTSQGRDLPGPGRTLAATLCALASR